MLDADNVMMVAERRHQDGEMDVKSPIGGEGKAEIIDCPALAVDQKPAGQIGRGVPNGGGLGSQDKLGMDAANDVEIIGRHGSKNAKGAVGACPPSPGLKMH